MALKLENDSTASVQFWLVRLSVLAIGPMFFSSLAMIWMSSQTLKLKWTLSFIVCLVAIWFIVFVHEKISFILRSVSGLLISLRETDYQHRIAPLEKRPKGVLRDVYREVNALRDTLVAQRTQSAEVDALLQKILGNIDTAIFAFDENRCLLLTNPKGLALLGLAKPPIGSSAQDLHLESCLEFQIPTLVERPFLGQNRRFEVRRATFRNSGIPHELLMLVDITRPLRQEELSAWKRLVSVLRHEIHNALTPIQSYSQSIQWMLQQNPKPDQWEKDSLTALNQISERVGLTQNMLNAYKNIARPVKPKLLQIPILPFLEKLVNQFPADDIQLRSVKNTVYADPMMLEQVLVNLLNNASDANQEIRKPILLSATFRDDWVNFTVEDQAGGIANPEHLFVPFFTTKKGGTGIGLFHSRQLMEAQGGFIAITPLENGTRAEISLPATCPD